MMTLDEARERIGSLVVYTNNHGGTEEGAITSVNDTYVFVRYGTHQTSAATNPLALTLVSP